MNCPATEISNLLYKYAESMDAGRLEEASEMFRNARVRSGNKVLDHIALLEGWRSTVKIHPDGTPRTKHVITNPIIEIAEDAVSATCRSYYTVLQATPTVPLQAIAAGRYHDEFKRVDGVWQFTFRDYSLLDLMGDMSDHLAGVVLQGISSRQAAEG